jgi:hypothetical protein
MVRNITKLNLDLHRLCPQHSTVRPGPNREWGEIASLTVGGNSTGGSVAYFLAFHSQSDVARPLRRLYCLVVQGFRKGSQFVLLSFEHDGNLLLVMGDQVMELDSFNVKM